MSAVNKLLKKRMLEGKLNTGLSVREISKISGVSISSISRALNGKEVTFTNGKNLENWAFWSCLRRGRPTEDDYSG